MKAKCYQKKFFIPFAAVFLGASMILCPAASAQMIDFIGSAKQSLSTFIGEPVEFDETLAHYEGEGGTIDLEVYTSDKIEKIVFSSIHIEENDVWEESVFIYPAEGYEFPVFWANLTRMFTLVNIMIFDFLPLQDLVMTPSYGKRYMEPLAETKKQVMDDVLKRTVRDKAVFFASPFMYVYSPYKMLAQVSIPGAMRIADVVDAYAETYISLCDNATILDEGERRSYAEQKLTTLREFLSENDPGYEPMTNAFGEEKTQEIMDVIF
jgi:hypothetical protein